LVKASVTMNLPNTHLHPLPTRETPAIVRMVTREDVLWNRPVFKAPPLVVSVPPVEELFGFVTAAATQPGR